MERDERYGGRGKGRFDAILREIFEKWCLMFTVDIILLASTGRIFIGRGKAHSLGSIYGRCDSSAGSWRW